MHAPRHRLFWVLLAAAAALPACGHQAERERLVGYWEGTIPLPASGDPVPIAYDFGEEGLTVAIGLGENRTVTAWPDWNVHSEDQGDLVVYVYRNDRVFSTLVRHVSDDELMLWDPGTEESTAATVRRAERPDQDEVPTPTP